MAEFIELVKIDSNKENEITQTIEKYNKESYATNQKQDRRPEFKAKSSSKL